MQVGYDTPYDYEVRVCPRSDRPELWPTLHFYVWILLLMLLLVVALGCAFYCYHYWQKLLRFYTTIDVNVYSMLKCTFLKGQLKKNDAPSGA